MRDLWMWGMTPPPAMVAFMRVSSSSSPRMASWRWRGVMRLTWSGSRGARGGREGGIQTGRVRKPSPKRFFPVAREASTRTVTSGNRRRGARATRGRGRGRSGGRTLRSLDALPASSRTSAVRYSARTGARGRGQDASRGFAEATTRSAGKRRGGSWKTGAGDARGGAVATRGGDAHRGWRRSRRRRWRRRGRRRRRGSAVRDE